MKIGDRVFVTGVDVYSGVFIKIGMCRGIS